MNNFTPRAQQVINIARREAERFKHSYIGGEHLLLGILKLGHGVAVSVIEYHLINVEHLAETLESTMEMGDAPENRGSMPYTQRAKRLIVNAGAEAKGLNHTFVGTEHLLLAMLADTDGLAWTSLSHAGMTYEMARERVLDETNLKFDLDNSGIDDDDDNDDDDGDDDKDGASFNFPSNDDDDPIAEHFRSISSEMSSQADQGRISAIKAFGRDLTKRAKRGELDPVIGRKDEIQRVIEILCRRMKNNPVLLGEAGVGKSAIVEGLAQLIIDGDVPEFLMGKRIISLDLAMMVAGTKYRGQFEERLKSVMDEIMQDKNIILFVDEIHTMIGAGSAEGTMDASNIIKPALSRGELQVIGATTLNEYRKHVEKDAAFERRFQQVQVAEPSVEDTILILQGLASHYEEHHKVRYTQAALEASASLSKRYLTGRFLPDKAIDVIDEAGAHKQVARMTRPADIKALQLKRRELNKQKTEAIGEQLFERAAQLRDDEKAVAQSLEHDLSTWRKNVDSVYHDIDEDDIMQVLSRWTGIPLARMEEKEAAKLLRMEQELKSKVIGQDEGCGAIARALRRSRADIKDPRRPIGSFLFMGPTGVGKTYLARNLAEIMFGTADALIQIDMSEYMEKHTTSRMIGSPPGYVGHDEGGQLTEQVRRRPYAVILFDEVEKAHPDVMNLLLQILEEGIVTDSLGRKINFRNIIIILTSNVGASLAKTQGTMGFGAVEKQEADYEFMKEKITEAAKSHFRPEFINRFDELIVFRMLEKKDLAFIVQLEAQKLIARLKEKNILLELSEALVNQLVERGHNPEYGARPMRRAIERMLEDPIAEAILRGELLAGKSYLADLSEDKKSIAFKVKRAAKTATKPAVKKATASKKTEKKPAEKAEKKRAPRRKRGSEDAQK